MPSFRRVTIKESPLSRTSRCFGARRFNEAARSQDIGMQDEFQKSAQTAERSRFMDGLGAKINDDSGDEYDFPC
jgi:hypothetical protein